MKSQDGLMVRENDSILFCSFTDFIFKSPTSYFLKESYLYLKGSVAEMKGRLGRGDQPFICCSLTCGHRSRGWDSLARSPALHPGLPCECRDPSSEIIVCCFPGFINRGLDQIRAIAVRTWTCVHNGCWYCRWHLNPLYHDSSSISFFFYAEYEILGSCAGARICTSLGSSFVLHLLFFL